MSRLRLSFIKFTTFFVAAFSPCLAQTNATFTEISSNGLANACYVDADHYVAEFLYQNPDVCFWSVDTEQGAVFAEEVPVPPEAAVELPLPSGGDDTAALEAVINANPGGSVVGNGLYRVRDLDITVPVDIYDMPMVPAGSASRMVIVNSPDVRIFNSPIDAQNNPSTHLGFTALGGSHRFTLVRSGVSNIFHRGNRNAAGVLIRGVDDFHLACNTFHSILNRASDATATARANAIWMNGRDVEYTSGGVIANNTASELQSDGALKDSEFFTVQSYTGTDPDRPTRLFANRALNAGKRFTKHQEDNAVVLSNYHEWSVKQGPLGPRKLLSHVEIQFSDNVTARNNRVKIAANSRFDYVFLTAQTRGTTRQDNVHYDCNDVEIVDKLGPGSRATPRIISGFMSTVPLKSTGKEATNSSARNNRIHGSGNLKHHYSFGAGYDDRGGPMDISGNVFDVPFTNSEYRRD